MPQAMIAVWAVRMASKSVVQSICSSDVEVRGGARQGARIMSPHRWHRAGYQASVADSLFPHPPGEHILRLQANEEGQCACVRHQDSRYQSI